MMPKLMTAGNSRMPGFPASPMRLLAFALVIFLSVLPALAVQPDEVLGDPALESRARALSLELRCLVCQNQSIDDSDAPLARDLRILVRERLEAGDTDAEVIDFIVSRYGEFVLLRPRVGGHTLALWLTPIVLLGVGGVAMFVTLRRRRDLDQPEALSEDERRALADALDEPS